MLSDIPSRFAAFLQRYIFMHHKDENLAAVRRELFDRLSKNAESFAALLFQWQRFA
jgi:hypothetical protein